MKILTPMMKYQMGKYNWTYEEWDEYYQIYVNNMNNLYLLEKTN